MTKLRRSSKPSALRGGYTTGACAAASARAAVRMLMNPHSFCEIEVQLPNQEMAIFPLVRLECSDEVPSEVTAGVIKDAGDDPDCTHGIEIQCTARWVETPGIHLKGGEGVATVTRAGLELPIGEPAINPVPRANIVAMAALELDESTARTAPHLGVELEITVPAGQQVAKETINERLGLVGGISILGTRGTVKPYSTSAFAASVRQSIQIAKANGLEHVVLTTGSRSEKAAMTLFPEMTEMALIQAGDFIGIGLRGAKRYRLKCVSLVVMIGKLGKLVSGRMMTHVSGHAIDFDALSQLAAQAHLSPSLCDAIARANTGRHVLEQVRHEDAAPFLTGLCQAAYQHANVYTANTLDIDVTLIDYDGTRLARYPETRCQIPDSR